ncbi:MAG TPA: helix-turn-helix domain-containing protein, partial [Sphingopyxis sp.]|nr:helix-turn-helix domain-containing protein [Sphingopyxis sp.]
MVTKAQAKPKKATSRFSSAERRASILAAAKEVFIRSGYAGARTKDIAIEAQINEALIYRHFASKEELFDAAVIEPLESWLETYNHAGRQVATAADTGTQRQL